MTTPRGDPGPSRAPWPTIYFRLEAPQAARVCVAGDFNDWDGDRHALHRNPNGVWECQVPLPPGRYAYHFVVDGRPVLDPHCRIQERAPGGTARCIIDVAAPRAGGSPPDPA